MTGDGNIATGQASVVVGGRTNTAAGDNATNLGGNTTYAPFAFDSVL